jgi:hypothetical protein
MRGKNAFESVSTFLDKTKLRIDEENMSDRLLSVNERHIVYPAFYEWGLDRDELTVIKNEIFLI